MTDSYFLLDPDYQTFASGRLHLKFSTLGGANRPSFGCQVVFVAFSVPVALVILLITVSFITTALDYQRNGVATQATIVKCQMVSARSGQAPELAYTYEVDNVRYEGQHFVARRSMSCAQFPLNSVLAAQYLLDRPSQSQITEPFANREPWEALLMYGAFLVATIFFTLAGIAAPLNMIGYVLARRRYRRLIKSGTLLTGKIVQANGEVRGARHVFCVTITYAFQTPGGRWLKGTQTRQREDLRDNPPACDTPVRILYADDRAYAML
jgi:hypothetical protein